MPNTLPLDDGTSFKNIQEFFLEAGPQALVGARTNDKGNVVLYRRDNLSGLDWVLDRITYLFTGAENYQQAKTQIESKINSAGARMPSGIQGKLTEILNKHQQNFYASEFIDLNKTIEQIKRTESRNLAEKGFKRLMARQDIDDAQITRLINALDEAKPETVAEVMAPNAPAADKQTVETEFIEFRKFIKARQEQSTPSPEIDHAAVISFEERLLKFAEIRMSGGQPPDMSLPEDVSQILRKLALDTLRPGLRDVYAISTQVKEKFASGEAQSSQKLQEYRNTLSDKGPLGQWLGLHTPPGSTMAYQDLPTAQEHLAKYYDPDTSRIENLNYQGILKLKEFVIHNSSTFRSNSGSAVDEKMTKVFEALAVLLDIPPPLQNGATEGDIVTV